jgi:Beta-galactosidase trimerisation domain
MWFDGTPASGMVPYHIIGGENGMGEDRRWLKPAQKYFQWMARHDAHFVNKLSIANVGVVMGQRTHLFYRPPCGAQMREYMEGMYDTLLEGRFLFDFVHEDKLAPEDLAKYSALLLTNMALLSDQQCRQLRAYVASGGSLLATFETSMYTERNERRKDFGLADVFGIRKNGEPIGTRGNAYLARIEKQHEILRGFSGTN